jgi:hypothetical protein
MAAPGYINGTLTTGGQANVNLTALGVTDWAVWGYGDGGTSTSLAPDVTLAGGTGISDLTYIDPNTQPLRGIGQFRVNYGFSWSNGGTDTAETGAFAGLQSYTSGTGNGVGEGFSFTVPAGTVEQQLDVFVDANVAVGEITASLSGGGVTPYADDSIRYGGNSPGEYVIDYAAPTDGQTLTVQWAETAADATQDNPAIFAVALSPVPEPADWALMAGGALLLAGWRRSKAVVGR